MEKTVKTNHIFKSEGPNYMFIPLTPITIEVHKPFAAKASYYIQRHTCPSAGCGCEILTCSCPDFQIGKPARGFETFRRPCKHIEELRSITGWPDRVTEILRRKDAV